MKYNLPFNQEKTKLYTPGDQKIVTGLQVNSTVTIPASFLDELDADLGRLKAVKESQILYHVTHPDYLKQFEERVEGKVQFVEYVLGKHDPTLHEVHAKLQDALEPEVEPQMLRWLDKTGDVFGRLWSPHFGSRADVRRQQVRFCDGQDIQRWVSDLFALKTRHQMQNLRYLADRKSAIVQIVQSAIATLEEHNARIADLRHDDHASYRNIVMGIEGTMGRVYWAAVNAAMPEGFTFAKRSRRPALDPFNAGLNYAYGMTYSWVERAVTTAGLDPYLGILHSDGHRRPSLVFDMIEPFRPWIDRWWFTLCMQRVPATSWFHTTANGGVYLNKTGKHVFIPQYRTYLDTRKVMNGKTARIRDHIYVYARETAKYITNHGKQ